MNTKVTVSQEDALDILFADRNRAYGAYQLRRQYPDTLARAFGMGLLLICLLLALPYLLKAFSSLLPVDEKKDGTYTITDVILPTPPPKPPVPSTPPPPARSTQRFVPPLVEEDNKVLDEPPKLTNEDLLNDPSDVGKDNIDVVTEAPPSIDDPCLAGVIESPEPPSEDNTMEMVDVQKPPSFPGGDGALLNYLATNIKYPSMAIESNIEGLVVLSFVVGKDGSINDIKVVKEIGGGCGKEAIRVVNAMPKWSPGVANGHDVKVRFMLPVRFKFK